MSLKWLSRGWGPSQAGIGVALAFYGLLQLIRDTRDWSHSIVVATLATIMILVILLAPFLYHLLVASSFREIGHERFKSERVCAKHEKRIQVFADRTAWVAVKRTFVFLEQPHEDDFYDSYAIDPTLEIKNFKYHSEDAVEVGRRRISPDKISVFWRPKSPIRPFIPYVHDDAWSPPVRYDQPAAFSSFICTEEVGEVNVRLELPFDVEYVCLFRRPRWKKLDSDSAYIRYALRSSDFRWGSAEILSNQRTIAWRMYNPPVGRTYDCVFFEPDGLAYWRQRLGAAGS